MTYTYKSVISLFSRFCPLSALFFWLKTLNETLRFSYVNPGPEITAYTETSLVGSPRFARQPVRPEISKIKTRGDID